MKAYRLKHLPTGLYFKPNTAHRGKNNLSKTGKLYSKKPSSTYGVGHLYVSKSIDKEFNLHAQKSKYNFGTLYINSIKEDWKIVEINLIDE